MKHTIFYIPLVFFILGCTKTSNKVDTLMVSETQKQRDICLDWYAYRIDTAKATSALDLKTQTESELMSYCDFFKNVADTK